MSLEPLLLLVCFDNGSRTLPAVRDARRFAVNVLRAGQDDLARVFSSKRVAREKFEAVTHLDAHGVPVIDGALAWLACDLVDLHPAGDHTIGIGEITHMDADPGGEPLVWFRGGTARSRRNSRARARPREGGTRRRPGCRRCQTIVMSLRRPSRAGAGLA